MTNYQGAIIGVSVVLLLIVYFIPSFIAYEKGRKHKSAILVLNIFTGWMFIGWVGALVWAFMSSKEDEIKVVFSVTGKDKFAFLLDK